MGRIALALYNALTRAQFGYHGEDHFGHCNIHGTGRCTTPRLCSQARKAATDYLHYMLNTETGEEGTLP